MAIDPSTPSTTASATALLPTLVQPLLALIHPTPLSFPPPVGQSPHPPITSVLSSIHVCALECLNNILLSLATTPNRPISADKESGRKVWEDVWAALSVVGTTGGLGQERRQDMWDIAVGVLWGIGEVWKGTLVSNCPPSVTFNINHRTFSRSHLMRSKSKSCCNFAILRRTRKLASNA
jgi:hypothetical protein